MKNNIRKTFIWKLGAGIFSLVDLGLLFKILHYPGANIMLLVGMGTLPILIFITAKYITDKETKQ